VTSRIQLAQLAYQETRDADQAFECLTQAEAIAPDSWMLVVVRASMLQGEGKAVKVPELANKGLRLVTCICWIREARFCRICRTGWPMPKPTLRSW